jgi:hypothetical protein
METLAPQIAAPSLSERVLELPSDPAAVGATVRDVLLALREGSVGETTADALVHESTRLALNWVGTGDRTALNGLLEALRSALTEAGIGPVLLSGLPAEDRVAVKVLELGRVLGVYLRANNAARDVSALAGARRKRWRAVMAWAGRRRGPFTASDVREAGFYPGRHASANEALEALVGHGMLDRAEDDNGGVTYTVTLDGRAATREAVGTDDVADWADLIHARAALEAQRRALALERRALEHQRRAVRELEAAAQERMRLAEQREAEAERHADFAGA